MYMYISSTDESGTWSSLWSQNIYVFLPLVDTWQYCMYKLCSGAHIPASCFICPRKKFDRSPAVWEDETDLNLTHFLVSVSRPEWSREKRDFFPFFFFMFQLIVECTWLYRDVYMCWDLWKLSWAALSAHTLYTEEWVSHNIYRDDINPIVEKGSSKIPKVCFFFFSNLLNGGDQVLLKFAYSCQRVTPSRGRPPTRIFGCLKRNSGSSRDDWNCIFDQRHRNGH